MVWIFLGMTRHGHTKRLVAMWTERAANFGELLSGCRSAPPDFNAIATVAFGTLWEKASGSSKSDGSSSHSTASGGLYFCVVIPILIPIPIPVSISPMIELAFAPQSKLLLGRCGLVQKHLWVNCGGCSIALLMTTINVWYD
ncbi:hypothetical protein ACHAXA_010744 [Cyclostephanos tholiformis]|uniref:Uncharacterized protein n=1 Tax=Cyclostephanos tholiformis TaxID=382380 RepID=A0ABD3RS81_9STRA